KSRHQQALQDGKVTHCRSLCLSERTTAPMGYDKHSPYMSVLVNIYHGGNPAAGPINSSGGCRASPIQIQAGKARMREASAETETTSPTSWPLALVERIRRGAATPATASCSSSISPSRVRSRMVA